MYLESALLDEEEDIVFLSIVRFQAIATIVCKVLNEAEFIKSHREESTTKTNALSIFHIVHRLVSLLKLEGGHTTGSHTSTAATVPAARPA